MDNLNTEYNDLQDHLSEIKNRVAEVFRSDINPIDQEKIFYDIGEHVREVEEMLRYQGV